MKLNVQFKPVMLLLLLAGALLGCGVQDITLNGQTMGTTYHVKLAPSANPNPSVPEKRPSREVLHREIQNRLDAINRKMSTYIPDSELSQFNQYEGDDFYELSPETFTVMQTAIEVSRITQGAFDITVGPLVNLYGFGPDAPPAELPDEEVLEAIRPYVGYRLLTLDPKNHAVKKTHPNVYCDLSAIAKGYAVDQIAELLLQRGYQNFMVEIGGEIRVHGHNAQRRPWRIAIEKPSAGQRAIHRILPLNAIALATSGDYRNFSMVQGQRVSHTIDPRTFRPIQHALVSVSVLHPDCMRADAFATALNVLGPKKGMALANRHQWAVLMLIDEGQGALREITSHRFPYKNG